MKVANIVTWDLETGGFQPTKHGLAEIAMIVMDNVTLEEIDRYEAIVAPYEIPTPRVDQNKNALDENNLLCSESGKKQKIDMIMAEYTSGALAVNGLTMKQINAGKDAKTVAKEIKAFCLKHKVNLRGGAGRLIPAGHNIQKFDLPYLDFFLSIFKIKMNDIFNPLIIDTMLWTRLIWPADGSIVNHKLGTACEAAGIQLVDAHRAMNDVEGNNEFVRFVLRRIRQQGEVVQQKKEKFRDKFLY